MATDSQDTTGALASTLNGTGPDTANLPLTPPQNDAALNPPGAPDPGTGGAKPRVWQSVLQGALYGLAGVNNVRGRGGFGSGLGAGAESDLRQQQIQTQVNQQQQEINQRQQQLQMESARAADSHVLALAQAKQADLGSQKLKLEIDAQSQAAKTLNDILGIDPPAQVTADNPNDMHAKAIGTLPTLAAANGGKIPTIATTNTPTDVGTDPSTHTVHVYATTPANLQQNPQGNRQLVNYWRMAQGLPVISDDEWKSGGGAAFAELQRSGLTTGNALLSAVAAGQKQLVDAAKAGLYVVPSISSKPEENLAAAQTLQNRINTFKSAPNYDPNNQQQSAALALMTRNLSFLQSGESEVAQKSAELAANQKGLETTAAANANKPFVDAEHAFQSRLQTQAKVLDRQNADQNARALKADTMITTEANNRDSDLKNIVDLKNNLSQIDNQNQAAAAAFQVKFAEHEIVEGGVKRLNETELNGLTKSLGTYGRQFQAWVTKGGSANQMPAATKDEMLTILNAEAQSRNDLYNQRVGNINQHILGQKGAAPTANQGDMDLINKFGGKAH